MSAKKDNLTPPRGARLVYLDVQRVRHEADFYTRLLEEVGSRGSTFRDLESTLRGKQVVVCLDEFEQVAGNEAFSESFFDGLRSLAQDGLALVTASQHSLFDLCRDKKFAGSQFWNIFHHRPLGLFTDSEARHFIQAQFTRAGVGVSDNEINQILQLAGRFPFFLQLACSHLFESRTGHAVQWERTFAQEAHDHLSALWEHLTLQEQSVLRWVLKLGAPLPDDHILEDLERRGLLVREDPGSDDWWVFSEAFAQIVQRPPKKTQNRKSRFSIRFKKFKITFWPPSIEIEGEGEKAQ